MTIQTTKIIGLQLEPETGILRVDWFDVADYPRAEVELSFAMIREAIQKHGVTSLLVNASQTTLLLDKGLLAQIINQYLMAVAGTKLKKIARISSLAPEREAIVVEVLNNVLRNQQLSILFRNFPTEAEARKWLSEADDEEA